MKLGKKFMLIITGSIFITTLPIAALFYTITQKQQLENAAAALAIETAALVDVHKTRLESANLSLGVLAYQLQTSLSEPPQNTERIAFDKLVKQSPDKAWRTVFDSTKENESGIFLPPDAMLNAEQKSLHLRTKKIFDQFRAVLGQSFYNIWFITPEKTEVTFDKIIPNFVNVIAADNDYTQTPWLTLGDIKANPSRELRWTTPLFDPVPKAWMVSAVKPIDVNGRWIGTIGHDIYLKNVMSTLFETPSRFKNELRFLLDNQNNVILAGNWQTELENRPESFAEHLEKEPELAELLKQPLTNLPLNFNHFITVQGKKYIAVALQIKPVEWHYFRLIAIDEILESTREIFLMLMGGIVLLGFGTGFLIKLGFKKDVVNPLEKLTAIIDQYGKHNLSTRANFSGNDEISMLAHDFDNMANDIQIRQTELKESRDQFEALVNNIPGITFRCALDADWTMLFISDLVEELTGYAANDFIRNNVRTYASVIYPDDLNYVDEAIQISIKEHRSYTIEYRIVNRSGEIHWVYERGLGVKDKNGKIALLDGFILDITERHKMEADLKSNQQKLALTNADLVQFTNIAAHHLQEPTRRIVSFTQRLEKELADTIQSNQDAALALHFIEQSALRQHALVRDIQLYLAAMNPRADIESVNVESIINSVIAKYPKKIREINAVVELGELPTIVIDRPRLFDIFNVLIENALAYHRYDLPLKIRIWGKIEGNNVCYWFEDNGIGIPIEYRDRVFLVFERLQVNENQDSTGIGLATLKRIIESCNGTVSLHETLDGGTTVAFKLPFSSPSLDSR